MGNTIRLTSGKLIYVNDQGQVELMYDEHGGALRVSPRVLSHGEQRELHGQLEGAKDLDAHFGAVSAQDDPRFEEATDYLAATLSPQELALVNRNPHFFNEAYKKAREAVGPSMVEIEAQDARRERLGELKEKLANREGLGPDELAEYLDMKDAVDDE